MKIATKMLTLGSVIFAAAVVASAVPVNITVNGAGALLNTTGVANNTQYAQGNNNPTSNLIFLNTEISNWNGAFNPDLPIAVGPVAVSVENLAGGMTSFTALAGYDYIVFHFGAGNAGGKGVSSGGWWQAFYLGGAGGSFTVPLVGNKSVGGFSSARYYNPVPDGGATVALLGLSLFAFALVQRRIRLV